MLSQRIRELRVAQGYSQVTLAKRLGVSKQAVSNWENDNIQPSIEMLLRLAQLFSVPPEHLKTTRTPGGIPPGVRFLLHVSSQNSPVMTPFSSTSMFSAAGTRGRPGMVMMSPV